MNPLLKIDVRNENFFEHEGQYDLVWDCTFLCALEPIVRERWASKMRSLVKVGGVLLTCIFPLSATRTGGPPYALTVKTVRALLGKMGFEATNVREDLPVEEHHRPGGFTGSDATALAEWRISRVLL